MVRELQALAPNLGRILKALGGMVFVSVLVPLVWGEYYAIPALVLSGLVPLGLGYTRGTPSLRTSASSTE